MSDPGCRITVSSDALRLLGALVLTEDSENTWLGAHVTFLCQRDGCHAAVVEEADTFDLSAYREAKARLPEGWSYEEDMLLCPEHRS
jgi:hypothetical protein